ncbi:hypothetical protein [Peribacillus deserti]|uniref:Lipoprotein n=1 Tax=Peribacillus deserti TaxID=673318 RepID=A0A2N5M0B6_9BACI|nr:hypothetical protein [Peribacillus deserti]PLT27814.1 hypothetical protein CUU66_21895 [Peribacillus deserti]
MRKYSILLVCVFLLTACGNKLNQLTRVDTQVRDVKENPGTETIITDEGELDTIRSSFKKIIWNKNSVPSMSRREDVKVSLFIRTDTDEPERINDYLIWFNGNKAELISSVQEESYGVLSDAKHLKAVLIKN